ncbi:MAG: ATPase P [Proteobacteria bacterium]|nr:ATPase P [Pseudomonadota bacterium]MBU1612478.1 ATPase P [Pseudomonadota bacterium]
MISVDVPGYDRLNLRFLVVDFNGTIALDGELLPAVTERIIELAKNLEVHVVTADTFGSCRKVLEGLPVTLHVLGVGQEDQAKLSYVKELGRDACVAIGNGRNDRLMLEAAELGICVVGDECCAVSAASRADVMAPDILSALNFILDEKRLTATLRS